MEAGDEESKEVTVEVKPTRVVFMSLFVLGKSFYDFHTRVNPSDFAAWLKKNHVDWSRNNAAITKEITRLSFEGLVEKIFELSNTTEGDILNNCFRKWYVQVHGMFRFSSGDRVFLTEDTGHLLQVLYGVDNAEIRIIGQGNNGVTALLPAPESCRNNWLIGAEGSDAVNQAIVQYVLSPEDTRGLHFKFINDDDSKNAGIEAILKEKHFTNYVKLKFREITSVPGDKKARERYNRYEQFDEFACVAEDKYKKLLAETPEAKRFADFHSLVVWNDRQHPKNNVTFVKVGFGNRLLNVWHRHDGFTTTSEEGATLCFSRLETGHVTVMLYPDKTDNMQPREDFIILEHRISPSEFTGSKTLKRYWKDLMAYMEATSIDGNPNLWQQLRVWWLRHSCHMVVGNEYQPTRRNVFWKSIWKFVVTVGLSGFVFYLLQFTCNAIKPDTTRQEYKDEIIRHIDSLQDAVRSSTGIQNKTLQYRDSFRPSSHTESATDGK